MIIQRTDPAFWEVRTLERRLRRGELTQKALEEHISTLPDVADKATLARTFAEVQHGSVVCEPSPLGGARFRVRLPAAPEAPSGLPEKHGADTDG